MELVWACRHFSELSTTELYNILRARQEVFIVEQTCPYLDADGYDQEAYHLMGWIDADNGMRLGAYLRIIPPGKKFEEASIGRVITTSCARGIGIGKELMARGIQHTKRLYSKAGIRIGAQARLEKFYKDLGFVTVSEPYDEDGIEHILMDMSGS